MYTYRYMYTHQYMNDTICLLLENITNAYYVISAFGIENGTKGKVR